MKTIEEIYLELPKIEYNDYYILRDNKWVVKPEYENKLILVYTIIKTDPVETGYVFALNSKMLSEEIVLKIYHQKDFNDNLMEKI